MGDTGVIDHFLEVFTRYIDGGFGLLHGEVAFIATTLVVIDVTLAALFWSWGADDDIMARLIKKTLFVGMFAYIIGNWNNLARIVFESFAGLGLKASGTGFSTADLLRPGKVAQTGLDAGRPLLDSISDLMGYWSFFENFIQIACRCIMVLWSIARVSSRSPLQSRLWLTWDGGLGRASRIENSCPGTQPWCPISHKSHYTPQLSQYPALRFYCLEIIGFLNDRTPSSDRVRILNGNINHCIKTEIHRFDFCQGWGRGFESLRPLQFSYRKQRFTEKPFSKIQKYTIFGSCSDSSGG